MKYVSHFYPPKEERTLLGKFYLSSFLSETTNIVLPFQFIFLFIVMDKPEWAVIPLIVEGLTVFFFEIPTGIVADRFGRKASVILGDILSGFAWIAVPLALVLHGPMQLIAVCLAFALEGIGQTLVSGAEEAWVVDNLIAKKKENLSDQYFAREKSLSSLGGVLSGSIAWLILTLSVATTEMISALWIIAGVGQILSALIQVPIPEYVISSSDADEGGENLDLLKQIESGAAMRAMKSILNIRPLLAFSIITLIISFATSITGDAFEISMFTKGLNPKDLAPLAVLTDLIGFGTPLLAVVLSRKMGPFNFLFTLLILPGLAVLIFFMSPSLITVVALFLFFNLIDDLWDPIADAVLHSYIPSPIRATTGSILNQFSELISLGGLSLFAIMLGEHSEKIEQAIPNLVEAFQGVATKSIQMPESLFGLPIQDSALVLFTAIGLFAAPIIFFYPWKKEAREIKLPEIGLPGEPAPIPTSTKISPQLQSQLIKGRIGLSGETAPITTSAKISPQLQKQLIKGRKGLDQLLEKYNPGELLSWNVSHKPFEMPEKTIRELKEMGPILYDFFQAANKLFYKHTWIQDRLEKRITPHYKMLNRCQPMALPRLIRPDVVCDQNWAPRLVELEITVGARADTSMMAKQYRLNHGRSLLDSYSRMAKSLETEGKNLAVLTAPHPFFHDLPDDAKAFTSMLSENAVRNIVVLTEENLSSLRFDGQYLWLNERFKAPKIIHVIDRFIDIYEIAELQHPGMGALLDAYLTGAITDINTMKQCLDEKDWMSLFWDSRLKESWEKELGIEKFQKLQKRIPKTWIITEDLKVLLNNGEKVTIHEIGQVKPNQRTFVIKESGTSTTASGAQAFFPIGTMEEEDIEELLKKILQSGVAYILQELVESPRISYYAINPDTDEVSYQPAARFKLSPFYIDGSLSDIRFVASDKKYAVNDDENCVVSVIRYS